MRKCILFFYCCVLCHLLSFFTTLLHRNINLGGLSSSRIIRMNFVYAPPPPPPPKSNNKNNGNEPNNSSIRLYSNHQNSSNSKMNYNESPNNFLDLPTHLPNETAPVAIVEDKVELDVEDQLPASSDPIFIPGTSISLQTEEDIAKWIEERKKKWPTRKNVELKQQQNQENDKKRKLNDKQDNPEPKKPRNVCKFFKQNKSCKFGTKCKNLHEASADNHSKTHYTKIIHDMPVLIPKLYANRQSTKLFTNLVQRDQSENENSLIIDFVEFLDKKGLIKYNGKKDLK